MWVLQMLDHSGKSTGTVYRLITGKEFVVGRKDCEIILEHDKSISRKHAVLTVKHSESNVSMPGNFSILQVEDMSKFGTYVNQIQVNKTQILKDGDVIKFGGLNSKAKINFQPLTVTTSFLKNNEDKRRLKNSLSQLGGYSVSEWQEENTHLVMATLVLTIKAVCALLCAKPIVSPQYFDELLKCIKNGTEEPDIKDFLPELEETSLSGENINFAPFVIRRKLFTGKTFLFSSSKQMSKLQMPIKLGGGEAILIPPQPTASYLSRPGVCVISPSSDLLSQPSANTWIQSAENSLKKNSRRFIPESEIGLAVVYCSTEKYCNPDFQIIPESLNVTSRTQDSQDLSTQDSLFSSSGTKNPQLTGNCSGVSEAFRTSLQLRNSRKHLRSSFDEEGASPQKIARLENQDEDEDLFGDPNASIEVINGEKDNMEIETITLDYVPPKSKNNEESQEIDISFANSNWTPGQPPNLESTRNHEAIENDIRSQNGGEHELNLTVVEIKSLVITRNRPHQELLLSNDKNFKKFKKAQPFRTRNTNISTNDMEMFHNPDHDMTTGWTQDNYRSTTDQGTQDEDLFDWEPNRKGRR